MAEIDDAKRQRNMQAWAECRADLEIEMGYPKEKRADRIKELIAQHHSEMASKPLEVELDPQIADRLSPNPPSDHQPETPPAD